MSPEPRDHSFDELTRGLARGTLSRGKALKLLKRQGYGRAGFDLLRARVLAA